MKHFRNFFEKFSVAMSTRGGYGGAGRGGGGSRSGPVSVSGGRGRGNAGRGYTPVVTGDRKMSSSSAPSDVVSGVVGAADVASSSASLGQELAEKVQITPVTTLPPASSKAVTHPVRPGFGLAVKKVADRDLYHYDVSISPEVISKKVNRDVMTTLVRTYGESHLAKKIPAYDGRKSLYTAGPLRVSFLQFSRTPVVTGDRKMSSSSAPSDDVIRACQTVADGIIKLSMTFPLDYDGATKQVRIRSILDHPDGGAGLAGQKVRISGCVRIGELQGKGAFAHIELNDGSWQAPLHVKVGSTVTSDLSKLVASGTCLALDGILTIPEEGKGTKRKIELSVQKVIAVGTLKLPLQPLQFLRENPQLLAKINAKINSIASIKWTQLVTVYNHVDGGPPTVYLTVEAELAFPGLEGVMNQAEAYVKHQYNSMLESCYDDEEGYIDKLQLVASTPFARVTYTEAIKLLEEAVAQGKKFENQVEWGIDLASEHERYLVGVLFQKPLIVYNYPKEIKTFYPRLNEDGKTVATFDVFLPKVGKIITGGVREERFDVITRGIVEMGLPIDPYEWYIELRRCGIAKHADYVVSMDRILSFAT